MPDDERDDATDNTILGVRMPTDLRERLKEAARREDRTESSFARYYLSKAADRSLAESESKPD